MQVIFIWYVDVHAWQTQSHVVTQGDWSHKNIKKHEAWTNEAHVEPSLLCFFANRQLHWFICVFLHVIVYWCVQVISIESMKSCLCVTVHIPLVVVYSFNCHAWCRRLGCRVYSFSGNCIYWFVCLYILLYIECTRVVFIWFMNHCLYVSVYVSLCIQVSLILLPRMVLASTLEHGSSL